MTIKQLLEKYQPDSNQYLTNKYNETLLRNDFLNPFFELLGWDIKNNAGKPANEAEASLINIFWAFRLGSRFPFQSFPPFGTKKDFHCNP